MASMTESGRDRRRRLTVDERRILYEQSQGVCGRCGKSLPADWHGAHLVAWVHGGGTTLENMQAWCASCNLDQGVADVVNKSGVALRPWQEKALAVALERIHATGVATIHAAPGAGKTIFAGAVFERLRAAGYVERLLVVVPSTALVGQWREALGATFGIHLDDEPRDGVWEHQKTVGAIVTYQSLPAAAHSHLQRIEDVPTMVVLDEVHHVGEQKAWGRAVQTMIGDVAKGTVDPIGVLNITGTLFRSTGAQRISTVRYDPVVDEAGAQKIQAHADFSVPTADLIGISLRPPDLYAYGAQAELVDLTKEEVVSGDIADLDRAQRSAVIREAFNSRDWIEGFCQEAVRLLANQQRALGREQPLKLLYVASSIKAARRAADALNRVTGEDFARLVVSDEPGALRNLRLAAREPRSVGIVSVRMVTEGFDCPGVSTIAYASNVVADLFVAQMMARAMRITNAERTQRMVLPAQILIPDHSELRRAFASALVATMHVLEVPQDGLPESESAEPGYGLVARLPRFQLLGLSDPAFRSATVLGEEDGEIPADEYREWEVQLGGLGVPLPFVPRIALASRRVRRFPRLYDLQESAAQTDSHSSTANPRSVNRAQRDQLQRMAKWMHGHVAHDSQFDNVAQFQAIANDEAGIPGRGRDQADSDQLARAAAWMAARVAEHCERHDEVLPEWLGGD
jgi:superfamily II DNA or RNA helicase